MKRTQHSKVMTIANSLVKQGYNRANAMVKAWIFVKLPQLNTNVAGVTYGKRQKAIERLSHYRTADISVQLVRDTNNAFDVNAVAVYFTVRGKGSYCMGYIPKVMAAFIAPLMDKGKAITSKFKEIRGMYQPYMNYGLRIEVRV